MEQGTKRKNVNPSRFLVYGLIDPRDRCLRYVGKTHKRREFRLLEHIEAAVQGVQTPVYQWIREVMASKFLPEIFILRKIPGDYSWQEAERQEITRWREWREDQLPYTHPPQTPKSKQVQIKRVDLLNVRDGG